MPSKITRVVHRHGDQKKGEPDLVIEVGEPLPSHYQRRPEIVAVSIEDGEPLQCKLNNGDVIYIRQQKITSIS